MDKEEHAMKGTEGGQIANVESCDIQNITCNPISELAHVWSYTLNPPEWTSKIIELSPRSNSVVKNALDDCHVERDSFKASARLDSHTVPRTLVCHDMKGGYLDDKYINPIPNGNGYAFYHWSQIDLFVYFSHHLVTIPPLGWINTAHSNGVKILGTFITEWIPGEEICRQILASDESIEKLVDALVNICLTFKLDGWLLNIENKVENVEMLKKFVSNLTTQLHLKKPESLIIWYDSVINDGRLKWQNELNSLNKCFFDNCDGIFLNYSWKEDNIKRTVQMAQHRHLDVYVGVDVFGRKFYGGGCFNTHLAVQKIREYNLSVAIFAQGWTHETLPAEPEITRLERFFDRDNAFWRSLWPYLYTHPITTTFQTFFYTGVDKEWFKLQSQEQQLSKLLHSQVCLTECNNVPTLIGSCNCLQLHCCDNRTSCVISKEKLDETILYVHHLFSCDISLEGKMVFFYYCKTGDDLNMILLAKNHNLTFKKIICYPQKQNVALTNNCSILELYPLENRETSELICGQLETPSDWELRCYLLNLDKCRILEIGAQINKNAVNLCGIGFKAI